MTLTGTVARVRRGGAFSFIEANGLDYFGLKRNYIDRQAMIEGRRVVFDPFFNPARQSWEAMNIRIAPSHATV